ncbi:MAG: serine/threonine-protein kinase, partial [Actinocatenispora sp.]
MDGVRAEAVLAGRYRLRRPLGADGLSAVWQAYDRVLERQVAVSLLTGQEIGAAARDRLRAETRVVATLMHPHVVNVFDYAETSRPDGRVLPFLVTELVAGESLAQRLAAGPLPAPLAVRVAAEVAEGLAAAHRLGVVHRDVTAANVVLTEGGAKLRNFGRAALTGLPASPGADIWSLGVLLHL